jgi:HAE1 family hydrophobic/amphiphilic exporter-1/multidrug efflux pump
MPKHLLRNNQQSVNRRGGLPIQYIIQTQNFSKLEEKIPLFMEAVDNDPTFQCLM